MAADGDSENIPMTTKLLTYVEGISSFFKILFLIHIAPELSTRQYKYHKVGVSPNNVYSGYVIYGMDRLSLCGVAPVCFSKLGRC